MVVCTAPRAQQGQPAAMKSSFHIFDLAANLQVPTRTVESPLKYQSRAVRIFADNQLFAVSSIEGRCAIKPLEARFDAATQPGDNKPLAFNFRCHRTSGDFNPIHIYPVNAIDVHPVPDYSAVFATGGSDGNVSIWQRKERAKLSDHKTPQIGVEAVTNSKTNQRVELPVHQPVTDVKFNAQGDMVAYAASYDWHKGAEFYRADHVPSIYVRGLTAADLRKK